MPKDLIYLNHPMFGACVRCFHESLVPRPTKYQNPLLNGLSILEGRASLPHALFPFSFSLSFILSALALIYSSKHSCHRTLDFSFVLKHSCHRTLGFFFGTKALMSSHFGFFLLYQSTHVIAP